MVCSFCYCAKAEEIIANNVSDELVSDNLQVQTTNYLNPELITGIRLYSSTTGGNIRFANRNGYTVYSSNSFVLYLTHNAAKAYRDHLYSAYQNALYGEEINIVNAFIGGVIGYYVSVKAAGPWSVYLGPKVSAALSAGLSWFASKLIGLTVAKRLEWMKTLYQEIDNIITSSYYASAGVYVSFYAPSISHKVGVQTY